MGAVLQVLFAERDLNMLRTINDITCDTNANGAAGELNRPFSSKDNVVVAIIGLAHVNSMLNIANDDGLKSFAEQRMAEKRKAVLSGEGYAVDIVYPDEYD